MKTNQLITFFLSLAASGSFARADGGNTVVRKDINPALQYYQAYLMAPDLAPADRDYLFDKEWRGQKLPEKFGELVARYDAEFRLVRQAARAAVPCDWGIDMSPGPATLLPHLARSKAVAQAARFRFGWDLQNGKPEEARDDLLATLALARNTSRDGTLISALVQVAIENIVCTTIAENFYQLSPELLKQLSDGIEAAPARGTMAACMAAEKTSFFDWYAAGVNELRKQNPGDDSRVMAGVARLLSSMEGGDSDSKSTESHIWNDVKKASGGTSDGVLKLLREEEQIYPRLEHLLNLPFSEFEPQLKAINAELDQSPNPFLALSLPAVGKAKHREIAVQVLLAMVKAAVQYKLQGEEALRSVSDPTGQGPFEFKRFLFQGIDRGFELISSYSGRGFPEVLIFVEKDGPPFYVTGAKAGQPVVAGNP